DVFRAPGERAPHAAVARIAGDVEAVDDSHAAGQFAGGLDLDVMRRTLGAHARIERDGHGERIGQGDADLAALHAVGLHRDAVAVDGEVGELGVERADAGD